MPYALFENEFRLSRPFPTAADAWRCAEDCGLVAEDASGQPRLEDGYAIKPCTPEPAEDGEPSGTMLQKI